MTPGASYKSVVAGATATMGNGSADANYPAQNVTDLVNINRPARMTPSAGFIAIQMTWPAPVTAEFLAYIAHNRTGGSDLMRLQTYTDAAWTTGLVDSGNFACWPSGDAVAGYPSVRPYVFPAGPRTFQSCFVYVFCSTVVEIGGIELGSWLPLLGMGQGKEVGFTNRMQPTALIGGGSDEADAAFMPRILNAEVPYVSLGANLNPMIDFQNAQRRGKPFVYVEDYDDATSWPRRCFLARNKELPPSVGALYRSDRFQLRFIEHRR